MTFIEFKKKLLDAEITLPKFCKLIKVSDKNIQSYKKKGDVPNTIAVIVTCFAQFQKDGIDYHQMIGKLQLKKQTKTGGFKKKALKIVNTARSDNIDTLDRKNKMVEKKKKSDSEKNE
jgi:hypothetical protein